MTLYCDTHWHVGQPYFGSCPNKWIRVIDVSLWARHSYFYAFCFFFVFPPFLCLFHHIQSFWASPVEWEYYCYNSTTKLYLKLQTSRCITHNFISVNLLWDWFVHAPFQYTLSSFSLSTACPTAQNNFCKGSTWLTKSTKCPLYFVD